MKVEDLILQLQDVISAAKSMPFSGGKVMVSSDEIYDILDQIQDAMPAEVRQAKNIVADRKQILAEANRESENIIRSAEERKKAMKPGKDSQVWATYTQEFYEGKPAVTTRKLGKGTVTYVGVDSTDGLLEKDILKKLYAQLNIPVMDLPYGVTLEYRNGMGIVLNYTDKPYKFVLPSGAKVLIGEPVIPTAGVLVFSITD